MVWSDFNGACNFLPSGISTLQAFWLVWLTQAVCSHRSPEAPSTCCASSYKWLGATARTLAWLAPTHPAQTVFAELRVSPAATTYDVDVGSVVTDRSAYTLPTAYPASSFSGMGADQAGVLVQFSHIGGGYYELRMPATGLHELGRLQLRVCAAGGDVVSRGRAGSTQ
jgi:hypothetical protein